MKVVGILKVLLKIVLFGVLFGFYTRTDIFYKANNKMPNTNTIDIFNYLTKEKVQIINSHIIWFFIIFGLLILIDIINLISEGVNKNGTTK